MDASPYLKIIDHTLHVYIEPCELPIHFSLSKQVVGNILSELCVLVLVVSAAVGLYTLKVGIILPPLAASLGFLLDQH